ncbi:MAG: esterase-like activity of phytase family protein [Phenylobacterium sp.]|uniref:esterase-like activity of phytase family protein n=1 Tax=Phenylobacterium sp. TaxID=1871053 RepID=UPI00391A742D
MRPVRRALTLLALLAAAACAPTKATLPSAPVPAGPSVAVSVQAVPLNPDDPAQAAIGRFRYAGGLALSSSDTSRLHGLSDVRIGSDGALIAVSDDGDLLRARLALDPSGRLTGVADARLTPMTGPDGAPLQNKVDADAEGLALLADGSRLVSFERRHRIWLYPANGGPPRPAPAPEASFPDNGGMEALAADPAAGAGAYVVGGEDSGQTWTCRLVAVCVAGPAVAKPPEFGLVAITRLPAGRTAYLLRAWDPVRGSRITLTIQGPAGEVDRMDLSRPLTVDNFEGLDALPQANGDIRFYLISDDNFSSSQRTLLLAFDWSPKS